MNLGNANNNLYQHYRPFLFPPPVMDSDEMFRRLNYANRRRRNRRVTGRGLLRYFVSTLTIDQEMVRKITNTVWKAAEPYEKADYTDLSFKVNQNITDSAVSLV